MSETQWNSVYNLGFQDIKYEKTDDGIAKITINRPEVRNAFRPRTVKELSIAFTDARDDGDIGVVILTGQGNEAFCSGGDQRRAHQEAPRRAGEEGKVRCYDVPQRRQ